MRQTTSPARPAACRGLGAAVLLALFALLHAIFSPGPSHLAALDPDGCRQRAAVAREHTSDLASAAVATGLGADGHHGGDAPPSCHASAPGARQPADVSPLHAVTGTAADTGAGSAAYGGTSGAARFFASAPSSGPAVLRC
ncbi:hypothetical protein [Streptomyces sp. NPDC001315]|uniref:hypothetical protein n=1 Tax=Streptomyces sp. NPDC001315 TaxID=3364562 RepID=UPI0036925DFC